jgi:nitrite reductase (NAD(P)H)
LIAPGIEMADILAFNLVSQIHSQLMDIDIQTQTQGVGAHSPRQMNNPDLSTRLKLMGVDVASFGDYFADARAPKESRLPPIDSNGEVMINDKPSKRALAADGLVKCLTYHDPFSATYKKYIFTNDGTRILGGMMIGDVGSFTKLVAMKKSKVRATDLIEF